MDFSSINASSIFLSHLSHIKQGKGHVGQTRWDLCGRQLNSKVLMAAKEHLLTCSDQPVLGNPFFSKNETQAASTTLGHGPFALVFSSFGPLLPSVLPSHGKSITKTHTPFLGLSMWVGSIFCTWIFFAWAVLPRCRKNSSKLPLQKFSQAKIQEYEWKGSGKLLHPSLVSRCFFFL